MPLRALAAVAALAGGAALARPDPDLVVADFEGDTYGAWTATGTAFGPGPARGTLPGQMAVSGFRGNGLVNSFAGGDKATGTLTSPPFRVERDYLNFLVGGGGHADKTCVNLLAGGKVVRSATGPNVDAGGSEALAAAHWDVKEFRGKEVVIQVVDSHTGGWGHINLDHVVQSDTRTGPEAKVVPVADRTRDVPLTGKYLLVPISNSARPSRMTVAVGGAVLHDFDVNLAADAADWWARVELPAHVGKTATVTAFKLPENSKGLERVESAAALRHARPLYAEALRPQLRFSQMQGWNNDPNGMVYHAGEWHLFWQSNPFGPKWGNMYWGHAVSRDLVHWEELPYALYPRTMAKSHCFSGSAHVDETNTGGWGKDAMVAAFTDTGAGEALAVSRDRGRTWEYLRDNPVIPKRPGEGRDPKLVWYAPGNHWVIAVYTRDGKTDYAEFYRSTDLRTWERTGRVPGYYECPELFELPVDGDAKNTRWVLTGANARYAVGRFDGKTFTPDHADQHRVHYGAFYAAQCFSRAPGGRVVQVGWARMDFPGMPFNQAFSLPIELKLKTFPEGIRLTAEPVKELETLRGPAATLAPVDVSADRPAALKAPGELLDIVAAIKPGTARTVTLSFGATALVYDAAAKTLDGMPLPLAGDTLHVRVVVDRPMYEVSGGNGVVYKTAQRRDGGRPIDAVTVTATGGAARVEALAVYPMRSIWAK